MLSFELIDQTFWVILFAYGFVIGGVIVLTLPHDIHEHLLGEHHEDVPPLFKRILITIFEGVITIVSCVVLKCAILQAVDWGLSMFGLLILPVYGVCYYFVHVKNQQQQQE